MTVAGVVVHGDHQWRAVESHIDLIVEKYIPGNAGHGFSFHAFEVFGGVKTFKDWPFDKRLDILDELAAIPGRFGLRICHCSMDRLAVAETVNEEIGKANLERATHAHAFFFCALQVEALLKSTTQDEVAMLIAEDREVVRKMLKLSHSIFRGKTIISLLDSVPALQAYNNCVPFERIIDTVHFARKNESRFLQLADVCAFAIKRHLMKKPHSDRLFEPIARQFILGDQPIGFGSRIHGVAPEAQTS